MENLNFIFSTNDLQKTERGLFVKIVDLHALRFCVLNNFESLRVLKPHFNLRLTCVVEMFRKVVN